MKDFAGKIAGQDTPVFTGIPSNPTLEQLKALSAALAASGGVSMFHAVGVTPEAPSLEAAFGGAKVPNRFTFGAPKSTKTAGFSDTPTWI